MFSLNRFLDVRKDDAGLLYRAYYAFFFSGMMANVLGSILPNIIETNGLSFSFQGTLLSVNQIGNLLAVWLSGFLPYAIGRRKSTILMGSGVVVGFVVMVLTGNPIALLLSFVCLGIGRGTMSNITNVLVGQYAGNKAVGLNLLHASFAIGAFISPFLVVLCGDRFWKAPAVIIACGMASALVLFRFSPLENTKTVKDKDESTIPKAASFWLNTFILFFYLCGESTFMGWLVTYFKNNGVFPVSIANAMSSLLWLMILISRLVTASVSKRFRKEGVILFLGSMMLVFTVILVTATNPVLVAVSVLCIGLSMGGIYPTTLATMEKRFNQSTIATGTCIAVATLGAVIMPNIVGYIADAVDISIAIRSILVPLLLMVVLQFAKLMVSFRRGR